MLNSLPTALVGAGAASCSGCSEGKYSVDGSIACTDCGMEIRVHVQERASEWCGVRDCICIGRRSGRGLSTGGKQGLGWERRMSIEGMCASTKKPFEKRVWECVRMWI